jgi:stage V sporulation protein R
MNEGTATYVHYRIMTGCTSRGGSPTAISSNSCSRTPTSCSSPNSTTALFGLQSLCARLCDDAGHRAHRHQPDDEDREWFPDIAGTGDTMGVLRDVWANYRDESFISQFLSPRLMRHLRMFHLHDDPEESAGIRVDAIHDERGYRRVRRELARQYDVGFIDANIEVVDVDLAGDRRLMLRHTV